MTDMKLVNAKKLLAKAIEKLSGYGITGNTTIGIIECLLELAPDESPRDWTPCAEGLPEDDKVVLVTASHLPLYDGDSEYPDTVFEAYHIRGTWRNTIDLQMANTKILAWQPLPAPCRADDTTGKVKED